MRNLLWAATLLTAAAFFVMTGCERDPFGFGASRRQGAQVVFGAASGFAAGVATKTEYSGYDERNQQVNAGSQYERINWLSSDRIRVWCEQATLLDGTTHYADYNVSPVSNSGAQSHAGMSPAGSGNGLQWGSAATHEFFALYPAPTISNGETVPPSSLEGISGNRAKITGHIPAVQTVSLSGRTFRPNMNYAYMYAAESASSTGSGSVNLQFHPLVTTFEFSFRTISANGLPASKRVTSFTLRSAASPLTGDFEATIATGGAAPVVATAGTGNSIRVELGTGVSLNVTQPYTITLFALPVDQEELTVELGLSDGTTRSLDLKSNGNWISVAARKKIYVRNLGVPDNMWTYTLDPIADFAITGRGVLRDTTKNVTVRLKRTNGVTTQPVAWKAWYCDTDSDDPANWRDDWENSWVRLSDTEAGGYTDLTVLAGANSLSDLVMTPGSAAAAMIATMSARQLGGSSADAPLDLSTYDFLSGSRNLPAETANTYVVNGHGWFALPLVYGNAVQGGAATAAPYTGIASTSGDNKPIAMFINADGQAIASSYILADANLDKSGNYTARIVWQDTDPTLEILDEEDLAIIDAPSGAALSCKYLRFRIAPGDIKPGNAVIALYDEGKEKILWSWHIWITDENFSVVPTATESAAVTMEFLNCNLGWTPPISYSPGSAAPRSQYVIVTKASDGTKMGSFKVSQAAFTLPEVGGILYSGTFYQWGRKDPFLPSLGYEANKSHSSLHYTVAGGAVLASMPNTYPTYGAVETKLMWLVRHPWCFVSETRKLPAVGNLWNAHYGGFSDTPVTKSVYDPCPRGFKVPRLSAFSGFSGGHSSIVLGDKVAVSGERPAGMMLTTSHSTNDKTLYFPAMGFRQFYYGDMILKTITSTGVEQDPVYAWTAVPYQITTSTYTGNGLFCTGTSHLITTYMPCTNGFPVRPSRN